MITRKEQEIINLLPKLCDGDTCRQVILMVDELSTLRDKIEKIEQIVNKSYTEDEFYNVVQDIKEVLEQE